MGDPVGRFTHLTFSIVVEILRIAARAQGYELEVTYLNEPLYRGGGAEKVAEMGLVGPPEPIDDLDPDLMLARRTDRNPYNNKPVPAEVVDNFVSIEDWTRAGHLMIRLWLLLTSHGVAWHPYGSVITNEIARKDMVDKFGVTEGAGGRQMVWLLVRLGYSDKTPVRSERLPLEEILL